jgi:hypothetical protein
MAGEKDYLYEVLATNLLMLLACKRYSAELNVLVNFTSKSASVVVDIDVADDKSLFSVSRTTTTATHQLTRITACGKTRIIRECISVNQHRSILLFQLSERVRREHCRRSPVICRRSIVSTDQRMNVVRERASSLKSTGTH